MQDAPNILTLFLLPLIFIAPGYVLYYLCWDKKLKLAFLDTIFLVILGSILISGWLGLILAELGVFSVWNLALLLLIILIPLIVKFHVHFDPRLLQSPALTSSSFFLILLLILASFLFLKPYPWILGGRDQGIYVNTAVNIAKTGSVLIYDSMLKSMDDSAREVFYKIEKRPEVLNITEYEGLQFLGFYITDKNEGEITPQFFYLYPTWLAIFYSIFGLELSLYATPLFALLAILGVFFLTKTMFGDRVALVASLLLTLNFAQIWYAREPSTEIFTQLLIFAGLATFILFNRNLNKYLGIISALCFGEVFLTRIDALCLIPLIIAFFAYIRMNEKLKREHILYFITPFSILSIHAVLSAAFVSTPYTLRISRDTSIEIFQLIRTNGYHFAALLLLVASVLFLIDFYRKWVCNKMRKLSKFLPYTRHAISLLILLAVFYSYFLRPTEGFPDAYNTVKLSWYVAGFLGVLLATVGSIMILYKKPYNESYLFLGIMFFYSAYFIMHSRISLDQPWWIRRFLPVVLPSIFICIAYFMEILSRFKVWNKPFGSIISSLLLIMLLSSFITADLTLINHIEYEGIIDDVEHISKVTENNSILIFGQCDWLSLKLSAPLNYIFDRRSFLAYGYNYPVINNQFRVWEQNNTIYIINPLLSSAKNFTEYGIFLIPTETKEIYMPLMGEHTQYGFPQNITRRVVAYTMFKVVRAEDLLGDNREFVMDLCSNYSFHTEGFSHCENSPAGTFRWSEENSYVTLPTPFSSDYILNIKVNESRKPPSAPKNSSVYLNDCMLLENLADGDNPITVPKRCVSTPYSTLLIHSETWIPDRFIRNKDMRNLGTIVESISIRSQHNQ